MASSSPQEGRSTYQPLANFAYTGIYQVLNEVHCTLCPVVQVPLDILLH